MTYVNQDAFFQWYREKAKKPLTSQEQLLNRVFNRYCETGEQFFVLPADTTVSGQEERYAFRFENVGCCGASTMFIYF